MILQEGWKALSLHNETWPSPARVQTQTLHNKILIVINAPLDIDGVALLALASYPQCRIPTQY